MSKSKAIVAATIAASAVFAGTASAGGGSPYYVDELKVSNTIESHGFYFGGHRKAVDSAFCSGLRRYGVHSSPYGLDKFWHFSCELDAANGHFYSTKVKTVRRGLMWFVVTISAKYDF